MSGWGETKMIGAAAKISSLSGNGALPGKDRNFIGAGFDVGDNATGAKSFVAESLSEGESISWPEVVGTIKSKREIDKSIGFGGTGGSRSR